MMADFREHFFWKYFWYLNTYYLSVCFFTKIITKYYLSIAIKMKLVQISHSSKNPVPLRNCYICFQTPSTAFQPAYFHFLHCTTQPLMTLPSSPGIHSPSARGLSGAWPRRDLQWRRPACGGSRGESPSSNGTIAWGHGGDRRRRGCARYRSTSFPLPQALTSQAQRGRSGGVAQWIRKGWGGYPEIWLVWCLENGESATMVENRKRLGLKMTRA